MSTLTMGSLFDGIGGFPLAASRNGITPVWASEIEAFPIKVTKYHFPDMLHVGDITQLDGAKLPPVDIICGGSPCQDLSIASGTRAGLAGARSGLFMEQVRIVKEMRAEDERRGRTDVAVRPRWMCWENVPGAFSSGTPRGEDFRIVLEEIVRIKSGSAHVPGPYPWSWRPAGQIILGDSFSLAWRVFDAQYWPRTPQRRRRIYLVADFAGRSAPQILFEQNSLPGYPAPGEGTRERTAASIKSGADGSGGMSSLTGPSPGCIAFAANQRDEVRDLHNVAGALSAQPGMKQQTFIAQDCLNPWDTQQSRIFTPEGRSPTLASADGGGGRNPAGLLFTAGFCAGAGSSAGSIGYQEEISPTLKATAGGNMMPTILCLNDQGGSVIECSENVTGTLRAQEHGHQPLVLFDNHGKDARYKGPLEVAPTVVTTYGTGGNNLPLVSSSVFTRKRVDCFQNDSIASTESARQHKDATDLVYQTAKWPLLIRRLTPLECERLQGYPDHFTDIPGASDSARYRALGNSVAIPCVEYVMRGIAYAFGEENDAR